MQLFIVFPYVALAPALTFLIGYLTNRNKFRNPNLKSAKWAVLLAVLVWILYAIWEIKVYFWSKTVVAAIRVDLLVITPILYLSSVVAAHGWWKVCRKEGQ